MTPRFAAAWRSAPRSWPPIGTVMRHRATRDGGSIGGAWFLGSAVSLRGFAFVA